MAIFLARARELGGACFGGKQVGGEEIGRQEFQKNSNQTSRGHHGRVHWHEGDANQPRTSFFQVSFCFLLFSVTPNCIHGDFLIFAFVFLLLFSSTSISVSSHFSGRCRRCFFRACARQPTLSYAICVLACVECFFALVRSIDRSFSREPITFIVRYIRSSVQFSQARFPPVSLQV